MTGNRCNKESCLPFTCVHLHLHIVASWRLKLLGDSVLITDLLLFESLPLIGAFVNFCIIKTHSVIMNFKIYAGKFKLI